MEYLIEDLKTSFHLKTGNKRTLLNNAPCATLAAPCHLSLGWCGGASLEPRQGPASLGTQRQMVGIPHPRAGRVAGDVPGTGTPLTSSAWHRVFHGGAGSPASTLPAAQSPMSPGIQFLVSTKVSGPVCSPWALLGGGCHDALIQLPSWGAFSLSTFQSWLADGVEMGKTGGPQWSVALGTGG